MVKPEENLQRFIAGHQPGSAPSDDASAEQLIDTYRQKEKDISEFYEGQANLDRKFSIAVSRGDAEQAERFIAQGADVNRQEQGRIPLIHEAAGLGHRAIVDAMLVSGQCDLTVRDFAGRLPSDVAAIVARDYELADRLAEEQARQFRARNMDPRRPDHPDYGNWEWDR